MTKLIRKKKLLQKTDSVILITGASSGIGEQFARHYGKTIIKSGEKWKGKSCHLLLVARRKKRLDSLKKKLLDEQTNYLKSVNSGEKDRTILQVSVIVADLSSSQGIMKLWNNLQRKKMNVSILINNAGFGDYGEFSKTNLEKNDDMIALNISTLTKLTRLILPSMVKANHGRIVQVASVAGFTPGPRMSLYFATKAFVLSFSLALRSELKKSGVHVTALCPGPVATEFSKIAGAAFSPPAIAIVSADKVAELAINCVEKNKAIVIPGIANKLMIIFTHLLGKHITTFITAKVIAKTKS